jgi:hypothetical protein
LLAFLKHLSKHLLTEATCFESTLLVLFMHFCSAVVAPVVQKTPGPKDATWLPMSCTCVVT